jgi:hypothetical protein
VPGFPIGVFQGAGMFRKVLASLVVLVVCVGFSLADEIRGVITKIDGNKVTFHKVTFDKDTKKIDKGEAQTLTVTDNCKFSKGKFNKDTKKLEAGDALEGGLKNEIFTKIDDKGVGATVTTTDGKITEIIVGGRGGKKKNNN